MRRLRGAVGRAGGSVTGATAVAGAAQAALYAMGLVTSVLIARALGPGGRGEYYLAVTSGTVALVLVHLSIETANVFSYSERGGSLRALSRNAAFMALVAGPAAVAVLLVFYALAAGSLLRDVGFGGYAIVVASVPFALHLLWLSNIFALAKRLPQSQLAGLLGAVLQLAAMAALYALGWVSVEAVLALYAATILIAWAIHVRLARAFAPARPGIEGGLLREVLGYGLRLHAGFLFVYLLLRIDVFLVQHYLGTADVGIYSLAVLLGELIWLVATPLAVAALPFQAEVSRLDAAELSFRAARVNLLLGLALALAFVASLWWAIPLLYGRSFSPAYGVTLVLIPGMLAMAFVRPLLNWLVRDDRPRRWVGLAGAALALNTVLNVALIPALGLAGAALASTIAYVALGAGYCAWGVAMAPFGWREALLVDRADLAAVARALGRVAAAGRRRR